MEGEVVMRKVSLVTIFIFVFVTLLSAQTIKSKGDVIEGLGGLDAMHNVDESIRIVLGQADGGYIRHYSLCRL